MEIYDPVHGNIFIDSLAKQIVDTEEFQRLRNIKQLGCCYYVFPGASHNRFEHSLGVYHLAKEYIQILNTEHQFTDNDIKCISIGALIHDLGHGPYSHLFDDLVSKEKNHEYRSIKLFESMNTKYKLGFTNIDIDYIHKIIYPKDINEEKKYLYQIVSNINGVDVDRFDYLMRDITMIGLNYGIEYQRIMKHSKIVNNEIIYSSKVKLNIDDFFRTRYIMYKEIYNHHTVRSIEFMIQEFLKQSEDIFGFKKAVMNDDWNKFILFTDSIIEQINFIPDVKPELIELVQRIKKRDLYKLIGEIYTNNPHILGKNNKSMIVDVVCLKQYGSEQCKYYTTKNIIDFTKQDTKDTEYVISVYTKKSHNYEIEKQLFQIMTRDLKNQ